jgi:hypothetical protein
MQWVALILVIFLAVLFFTILLPLSTGWPFSYYRSNPQIINQSASRQTCPWGFKGDDCSTLNAHITSTVGHVFTVAESTFELGQVQKDWVHADRLIFETFSSSSSDMYEILIGDHGVGLVTPVTGEKNQFIFTLDPEFVTNSPVFVRAITPAPGLQLTEILVTLESDGGKRDCSSRDAAHFTGINCDSLYSHHVFADGFEFNDADPRVIPEAIVHATWKAKQVNVNVEGGGTAPGNFDVLLGTLKLGEITTVLGANVNATFQLPNNVSGYISLAAQVPFAGMLVTNIITVVI